VIVLGKDIFVNLQRLPYKVIFVFYRNFFDQYLQFLLSFKKCKHLLNIKCLKKAVHSYVASIMTVLFVMHYFSFSVYDTE
jgi:hypothetical protein